MLETEIRQTTAFFVLRYIKPGLRDYGHTGGNNKNYMATRAMEHNADAVSNRPKSKIAECIGPGCFEQQIPVSEQLGFGKLLRLRSFIWDAGT